MKSEILAILRFDKGMTLMVEEMAKLGTSDADFAILLRDSTSQEILFVPQLRFLLAQEFRRLNMFRGTS